MRPWLNLDAGELPDEPEALLRAAHLLHAACGGHAGDAASMARVVDVCARGGPRLGAHPSYPDREGFGRRAFAISPDALTREVAAQCAALRAVADARGVRLVTAKLHGALYHDAARSLEVARAALDGIAHALGEVALVAPADGALANLARARGVRVHREGFADRGLAADGTLVPRGAPGALVTDPEKAAAQALALARRGDVDTICVHGDGPTALAVARAVRDALDALEAPP